MGVQEYCLRWKISWKQTLFVYNTIQWYSSTGFHTTCYCTISNTYQDRQKFIMLSSISQSGVTELKKSIYDDRWSNIVFPIYNIVQIVCSHVMTEFWQTNTWMMQRVINCSEWICKHVFMSMIMIFVNFFKTIASWYDVFNFGFPDRFHLQCSRIELLFTVENILVSMCLPKFLLRSVFHRSTGSM